VAGLLHRARHDDRVGRGLADETAGAGHLIRQPGEVGFAVTSLITAGRHRTGRQHDVRAHPDPCEAGADVFEAVVLVGGAEFRQQVENVLLGLDNGGHAGIVASTGDTSGVTRPRHDHAAMLDSAHRDRARGDGYGGLCERRPDLRQYMASH
jgi:hypothetical protein